jgi:hypothetical protein
VEHGPVSVAFEPQPIPNFTGFIEDLVGKKGYGLSSCPIHCPYRDDPDDQHAHLSTPSDGEAFIIWADGRYSGYDLTLSARLIYAPVPVRNKIAGMRDKQILAYDMVLPKWPEPSDIWTPLRDRIPRASRCYRADAGFMVHVQPDCRCRR